MGAPPTSHVYPTDGSDSCFWTNPDGSEVWANFTNDTVDVGASYTASQGATSSRFAIGSAGLLAVLAVFAAFTAVVFGACLFVATKLFGYSIGVNQVILFAVVTGAVRLVPYVGWLLALLVGVALIERWSSAGWWTALLIILVAGFVAGVLTATVVVLDSASAWHFRHRIYRGGPDRVLGPLAKPRNAAAAPPHRRSQWP